MRSFLLIFILLCTLGLSAQDFAFEYWHEGKLVLETGDTIRGYLKYNLQTDVLQVKNTSTIDTYTARNTLYFEIFDQTVKRYRQFYSLPFATSGAYKAPVFFELVEEGKITLLCREAVEYRTYSSSFYYYGSYSRLVLVNKYFLLKESGDIEAFLGTRRNDWLDLMQNRADEIQRYARTNRLDFDEKYDIAKIVAYYNSFYK
ncbi:MAG: hypothetical protein AB7K37_13530 [Cyclobacteriaceae bacterium]